MKEREGWSKPAKKKVSVTQGDVPVERPILAQSIVDISKAMRALEASGLNRHAIIILVSASSGLSRRDVGVTLDSLRDLEATYCNPKRSAR